MNRERAQPQSRCFPLGGGSKTLPALLLLALVLAAGRPATGGTAVKVAQEAPAPPQVPPPPPAPPAPEAPGQSEGSASPQDPAASPGAAVPPPGEEVAAGAEDPAGKDGAGGAGDPETKPPGEPAPATPAGRSSPARIEHIHRLMIGAEEADLSGLDIRPVDDTVIFTQQIASLVAEKPR